MLEQQVLSPQNNYIELDKYLQAAGATHIFLVCGSSIRSLALEGYFQTLAQRIGIQVIRFSGFQPNPDFESVMVGSDRFRLKACDLIVAVGGGSAIDVAKCIRNRVGSQVPLLAIPTTAGSGSEATHFAVVYKNGIKESVDCGLPDAVLFDPSVLNTLPDYQRKSTMLDALCHGVESFWALRATPESQDLARRAIRLILENKDRYLANDPVGNRAILTAANFAGQAINLTTTTAGHAMSYGLSRLCGIAHGHAAALCVAELWPYMLQNLSLSSNPDILKRTFQSLAQIMDCETSEAAASGFRGLLAQLDLALPSLKTGGMDKLVDMVNVQRLSNNPIPLERAKIEELYRNILRERG